jgi:hypothetical protein
MNSFEKIIAQRLKDSKYDEALARTIFTKKFSRRSVFIPLATAAMLLLTIGATVQLVLQHREDQIFEAFNQSLGEDFLSFDVSDLE